jgi:hypothetical protein
LAEVKWPPLRSQSPLTAGGVTGAHWAWIGEWKNKSIIRGRKSINIHFVQQFLVTSMVNPFRLKSTNHGYAGSKDFVYETDNEL